jgi:PucR family transcriptional regulator, purine catabolism regulatory protein
VYPTVADVLTLPVVRQGMATVVAGANGLDRKVRWVHIAEIADIAPLLGGGELVLTTGIALPDDAEALGRYVAELAGVGVVGVVVELVRHWRQELPAALTEAADAHDLPLITLSRETRFVAVTEAVVGLIVAAQVAELRAAERVHETFTALTVAGAEPAEVLREVARASDLPVVLETLGHDVLAYDAAGTDPRELVADWAARSRAVTVDARTSYHEDAGWLVTVVGARGNDWGRLVLVCPAEPQHRQVVIAERAASALAVHRLVARDREGLERHAHRTLLTELLGSTTTAADLAARANALGVPLQRRQLLGMSVRPSTATANRPAMATQELLRDLAEATALAARRARVAALDAEAVLRRLSKEIHQAAANAPKALPVIVAVGTTVDAVADARRSMIEAAHVATAALRTPDGRPYHRLDDVRLRGLLHLLADDDRMTAFAARELGPLLSRDAAHGSRLIDALRHFCEHGGNKSAAAAAAHMSRTAYYQQLARIEQVLGVPLDNPESVLSLHVALLVEEINS